MSLRRKRKKRGDCQSLCSARPPGFAFLLASRENADYQRATGTVRREVTNTGRYRRLTRMARRYFVPFPPDPKFFAVSKARPSVRRCNRAGPPNKTINPIQRLNPRLLSCSTLPQCFNFLYRCVDHAIAKELGLSALALKDAGFMIIQKPGAVIRTVAGEYPSLRQVIERRQNLCPVQQRGTRTFRIRIANHMADHVA